MVANNVGRIQSSDLQMKGTPSQSRPAKPSSPWMPALHWMKLHCDVVLRRGRKLKSCFKISVDNGCLELELQTFKPCINNISIMQCRPIQLATSCQGAGGRSCSYLCNMNTKSERVEVTFHRKVWCLWHAGENSKARTSCKLKGREGLKKLESPNPSISSKSRMTAAL